MEKINEKKANDTYIKKFTPFLNGDIVKNKDHSIDAMVYIPYKEKHRPVIYGIYDYLKGNCVGYENRIKSYRIMEAFGIANNEEFRSCIQEIRDSDVLQKIVCSEAGSNGGYWIATNDDEVYMTLQHLYKRSIKMLHTYSKMKRKHSLNNQMRLKLSEYEKEMYQSIMEVE